MLPVFYAGMNQRKDPQSNCLFVDRSGHPAAGERRQFLPLPAADDHNRAAGGSDVYR